MTSYQTVPQEDRRKIWKKTGLIWSFRIKFSTRT